MKRNGIIIGSAGLIAIAAIFAVSPWVFNGSDGTYRKKDLTSLEAKSAEDAQKWLKARYRDQATGETISPEKLESIRTQIRKAPRNKAISFIEQGPDNIGGRTRAIQVNRNNINQIWAGGVSGGLFVSNNRGHQWTRVDSYANAGALPFISSMTQTPDGTLYVATGSNQEGWNGNGVWYSTDGGGTWAKIPGTTNCTEIVSSNADSYAWMATGGGLKKWKLGDAALTNITVAAGSCNTVQISKDGQVIVAAMGSNKTFVSNDGGSSFTDKSGSGATQVPVGAARIEYAISASRVNGSYSLYAVRTNSNLQGMNLSHDNGVTWHQFIGASGTPSNLDIYRDQGTYNSIVSVVPTDNKKILIGGIDVWQWKQTVDGAQPSGGFEKLTEWFLSPTSPKYAHADNHEMKWDGLNRIYIGNDGGIGISDDYGQNWYPANRGYNVTQFYGIAYDSEGAVMGGTQDNGTLYNDHSWSTLLEFIEVGGGDGFECEISFFNRNVMFSSIYYNSISRSGDRGASWASFVPNFPSSYDPAGTEGSIHPFFTVAKLAEYYDLNSEDSVTFIATKDYAAGTTISIPSLSTGDSMKYVTPVALVFDDTLYYEPSLTTTDYSVVNEMNGQTVLLGNYTWTPFPSASGTNPPTIGDTIMVDFPTGADTVVVESVGTYDHYYGENSLTGETVSMGVDTVMYNVAWDTLRIQDPFQSWFLMYVNINGGELWGTRNALRLSATNVQWVKLAQGIGSAGIGSNDNMRIDIEFSKDLNYCYITGGSNIQRIVGLGSIYTSDPLFASKAGYSDPTLSTPPSGTTKTTILTGTYEGIAINPNNANDLVVFAPFSGTNRRSLNATAASPTFTALANITTPNVASYDGIIDRDDPDIIVVGTSEGVVITEDGGATWTWASTGFEGTPVFSVKQNWRTWNEGNHRPGEIYIGTYGRGIWSSSSFLGLTDNNEPTVEDFKTKLKAFPNPTTDNTTLTFNLFETSNVEVNVYSISGQLVKSISKKNMPEGSQTISIDGSDLNRGTYIVKFVAGKQNENVKFIKL